MEKTKAKSPYSMRNNLAYVLKNMWKCSKGMTAIIFLKAPFVVGSSFLGILLSKQVVEAVASGWSAENLMKTIFLTSFLLLLCGGIVQYLSSQLTRFTMVVDIDYIMKLMWKCIFSDYETMESPSGQTSMSKAKENVGGSNSSSRMVADTLSSFWVNIIGIISYALLLFTLSPWILLTVSATTIACFFFMRVTTVWTFKNKDKWKTDDRKLEYLRVKSKDFSMAKDLRLYGMTGWFRQAFQNTLTSRLFWDKKQQVKGWQMDLVQDSLALIREVIAYGGLIYIMFTEGMPVSDFVLYFGVISGFSNWLFAFISNCDDLLRVHLGVSEIRQFIEYPDITNRSKGEPLPTAPFSITFENVSYRYSGSEKDTIHDLNLTINKGEKLAIVGMNGAGKTTFAKLLCGLYQPTSGRILIDGQPVNSFNRLEYYTLYAAVFQDIFVLPQSILHNLTGQEEENSDMDKVKETLTSSGIGDKIHSLPEGMNTRLIKGINEGAIELSGGEMQKLALARALYKGGQALILDEPTAALDPIAESNIYNQYSNMCRGKTSIFISHRLASTRFCDRILLLEHGAIVEYGSHDQLMELGGKYSEMFEIQSHYYKEEVSDLAR